MSNSILVDYVRRSPNHSGKRNHVIDTVTVHCVVGQCTVESLGKAFANPARRASSNYGIGRDGKIGLYVDECNRSWCSSNAENDNRAITIEVASDNFYPYAVRPEAYESLIRLLVDICRRNNIPLLLWKNNPKLIGHPDQQNMTVHRWFANKACPGEWLMQHHPDIAAQVNAQLAGSITAPDSSVMYHVQVGAFKSKENAEQLRAKLLRDGYQAIIKKE